MLLTKKGSSFISALPAILQTIVLKHVKKKLGKNTRNFASNKWVFVSFHANLLAAVTRACTIRRPLCQANI
jgi:hypothetical protein